MGVIKFDSIAQRIERQFPELKMEVQFLLESQKSERAYGSTVERGIRIAKIGVQFSVGPQFFLI